MKVPSKSLKVLLVEDSQDDALLILDELKRGGFAPVYQRVETKAQFIEVLEKGWEMILVDYSLPRFGGDDALNILNKSGFDIPLIIISGSITEETAVLMLKNGAKDFITKDNLSRLVPAVQRELDETAVRRNKKILEAQLVEKEAQINTFFNSANEAFILLDKDLRFIQVNPMLEARAGMTNNELKGKKISEIFPIIEKSGRLQKYENVLQSGTPLAILNEKTYPPALGEMITNLYAFKVGDGLGIIVNDVTEINKYEKRLEALHEHALKLASAGDIEEVSGISLEVMSNLFNFRFISFLIVEGLYLKGVDSRGAPLANISLQISGIGITSEAARTGKTVLVNDLRKSSNYVKGSTESLSELAVPVLAGGKAVAVLNAESDILNAFSEEDGRLLELLSMHVASAMIRLEQVSALKDHEKRLLALNECASKLAVADNEDRIWDIALDTIDKELKPDFVGIGVVEEGHLNYIRYLGIIPTNSFRLPLDGPGITIRAIRTGETQLINDIRKDVDFIPFEMNDGVVIPSLSELVALIRVGDVPYAVINIENSKINAFDENDKIILEILTKHIEEAINRALYVKVLQQQEHQMASLHTFTHKLTEANTIMEACAIASDSLKTLFNTTNGSISVLEEDTLRHKYVYGVELNEEYVQPLSGQGITVRAANTGEPQLIPDVLNDPMYMIPEDAKINTRSELAVPVKIGGQVVAVLNIESPIVNAFTSRDESLLEILAMHLSSTFARIRENESKERYRSRLEALNKLVPQLDSAQSPLDTAIIAEEMIYRLSPSEHARLALVEGDHLVAVVVSGTPQKITRLPLNGKGLTVKAVKTRKTIYIADTTTDKDFMKGDINTLSELVIPLFIEDKVIGVLNIESTHRNAFTPDDIKLAETLALNISSTLERLRIDAERLESQLQLRRKQYEAEQAKELERMKTRFISTATHEIRTPLTSIKGYTELIQAELEGGDLETTKRYFNVVGRNVDRLIHLTDDLLDTQRIEDGRMTLNQSEFDVDLLLNDLITDMTPLLSRRKQTLSTTNKIKGKVYGDRSRLMQVLVNLITNTHKFSPEETVITLTVESRGKNAFFSVRDMGVGLSEEEISRLFKPFPGIHVEGNTEGTGLGLSISKGIIQMHGGRIWAESNGRGKGATFSFTIPEEKR